MDPDVGPAREPSHIVFLDLCEALPQIPQLRFVRLLRGGRCTIDLEVGKGRDEIGRELGSVGWLGLVTYVLYMLTW